MKAMLDWYEMMQHKAMSKIFGKSPHNDASDEKRGVGTHSELRNRKQDNCEQGRYQHFAKIDGGSHESTLLIWRVRNLSRLRDFVHGAEYRSRRCSLTLERVSEVDLMSAIYPLSVHRRIEQRWAERIKSLGQIHGRVFVATERTLQHVFNNDGSLIPVPIRRFAERRRLEQSRPHD